MQLISYYDEHGPRLGVSIEGGFFDTPFADVHALLEAGGTARLGRTTLEERRPPPADRLLPAVPRPSKMLFCGLNYEDHLRETGKPRPTSPFIFSKLPSSIVGPGAIVPLPYPECQLDYEGEIAVVVGRTVPAGGTSDPERAILGFTVLNDLSARDIQRTDQQITLGKGLDGLCPMAEQIAVGISLQDLAGCRIETTVNGELRQRALAAEMLFDPAGLIAYVSTYVTLFPGDVIATGTPAGVGAHRQPASYLMPGDTVRVSVDGIGALTSTIAHPRSPTTGSPTRDAARVG